MKLSKRIYASILAAALGISAFSLVGCGKDEGKPEDAQAQSQGNEDEGADAAGADAGNEFVFEAEYTMLEGLEGLGVSGSPSGIGLAAESGAASNGFYVGNLGVDSPITFVITSDQDTTATLKGVFGSNILGNCSWDKTSFVITVNGTAIDYEAFTTEDGTDSANQQNFKTKTLGEIQLVSGKNEITFVAGDNTYRSNLPSAPSIDCIKLSTSAALTMETYESNIE